MAIIGSFSNGSASAVEYSTIEELLSQLPDNTNNIIGAQDIRDSIYTLWEKVNVVISTQSVYFDNSTPTPIDVGGIPAGSTFSSTDVLDMWQQLLYPYIAPSCSLGPNYSREYGDPDGLTTDSITLNWSVTKNTNNITSITVDGDSFVPTGNSQAGTKDVTGTHSVTPGTSQTNTFSMTTTDGTQVDNDNSTITWSNRIYWGSVDLGGVNFTTTPGAIPGVAITCDDTLILNFNGSWCWIW